MVKKESNNDESILLNFYKRYDKGQLRAILEMIRKSYNHKMLADLDETTVNKEKLYVDTMKMKIDVIEKLILS